MPGQQKHQLSSDATLTFNGEEHTGSAHRAATAAPPEPNGSRTPAGVLPPDVCCDAHSCGAVDGRVDHRPCFRVREARGEF